MILLLVLSAYVAMISGDTEVLNNATAIERIIGGSKADIREFPHLVSLQYLRQHICGGSIISAKHVLTAAHCTIGTVTNFLTVSAGTTNIRKGKREVRVRKVFQHPLFSYITADYDVSVLELRRTLEFNENIRPISLASELPEPGTMADAAGWGVTKSHGTSTSNTLKAVQIPIVDHEKCRNNYRRRGRSFTVTDRMICAGYDKGGKNICSGDSGGSLSIGDEIYGISSWSVGCALPNRPAVFTSVPSVMDFINSTMES